MKVCAAFVLLVLFFVPLYGVEAQEDRGELCHDLIQQLSAAALRHAFVDAEVVPDLEIAQRHEAIYVLNIGDFDGCILDQRALPGSTEQEFVLASRDELIQIEASLADSGLSYVVLSAPIIIGENGAVGLGTSTLNGQADRRGSCGVRIEFVRVQGSWRFTGWGIRRCE